MFFFEVIMFGNVISLSCLLVASTFGVAFAGKTYQVTGPVLEVTDIMIVIQKGKDKWEISKSADTKVTGELKVGSKVTIEYTMAAASVDVKPEKTAKK
jgi:hypothetical protein